MLAFFLSNRIRKYKIEVKNFGFILLSSSERQRLSNQLSLVDNAFVLSRAMPIRESLLFPHVAPRSLQGILSGKNRQNGQ